jgi:hypothetical protein
VDAGRATGKEIKMARSIGRINIGIVKDETLRAIREKGNYNVEELVVSRLDEGLWDTWEGADSEIRRVIDDTINRSK